MKLKDKAYDIIKERIINCVYAPGSPLNEKEITDEIQVSRTPYREAINALHQEDLVEFIQRGVYVANITLKDINDLYAVRGELEPFAVRLASQNIPDDVLASYYESMKAQLGKTSIGKDEDLHQMILQYANNKLLSRMMGSIYTKNHRISVLCAKDESNLLITKEQHFKIIERMKGNDTEGAVQAMREHISSSKERALKYLYMQDDKMYIR